MQDDRKRGSEISSEDSIRHTGVPFHIRSIALVGIFILAVLYTIYLARAVLLPIILALLLTFLLRPLIRLLKKIKIPEVAGSSIIILVLIGMVGYGTEQLAPPADDWINRAPETLHSVEKKMRSLTSPVQKVTKTAEELQQMTASGDKEKSKVEIKEKPKLLDKLFEGVQGFFAIGAVMGILLFFLLASGDIFVEKISVMFPRKQDKKEIVSIVADIERSMSKYLLTVTVINITEGIVVGAVMYMLGMPNPVLWGVMATFLIFIPYLGPLTGIAVVGIVSLLTFDNVGKALLAPGLYFIVEALQGQIITPIVLGRKFELNPVIIFIWLIFWGWAWGIPGALIAVPLLTLFKILCDHVEALGPVGKFLEK
jgi:predicted PurR-regulated permease PerM